MNQFAKEVIEGLQGQPKRLPSKYFYDEAGDKLFQQIMQLEEYYLTRTEYAIFNQYKEDLLHLFANGGASFNLIEFGAGDGHKTKVLLRHFLEQGSTFNYMPIDISGNVLKILETALKNEMPMLQVKPIKDEYFKALASLKDTPQKNVVLFLGSNIGNFTDQRAVEFLSQLYEQLKTGDLLLIGFDLKKHPDIILAAYNDKLGVTKAFNFNLLKRINAELGGNFDLNKFEHYPVYNPLTGTTASYLVSTEKQTVEIMDAAISIEAWEAIHMEISQKYDQHMITRLADDVGFKPVANFFDNKRYFVDAVWQK